jgi:predicted small secreted protein
VRDNPLIVHGLNAGTIVALFEGTRHRARSSNWENVMKRLFFLAVAGALALIAGCNTIEGAGQDIKGTGRAIERAADDAKPK